MGIPFICILLYNLIPMNYWSWDTPEIKARDDLIDVMTSCWIEASALGMCMQLSECGGETVLEQFKRGNESNLRRYDCGIEYRTGQLSMTPVSVAISKMTFIGNDFELEELYIKPEDQRARYRSETYPHDVLGMGDRFKYLLNYQLAWQSVDSSKIQCLASELLDTNAYPLKPY